MSKFLGEEILDIKETPFRDFDEKNWSLYFIERYGGIDGDHHKLWVMDQIARINLGTLVIIKQAKWANGGIEYRVNLGDPSDAYLSWVEEFKGDYDAGSPP